MRRRDQLLESIAQLLDARFKTFELNMDAKIKASEERIKSELRGEFRKEIRASERRIAQRLDAVEGAVTEHGHRITRLEKQVSSIKSKN